MTKAEIMVSIAAAFRVVYDDAVIQFMLEAMEDISVEELHEASKKIMQRCRTMPSVAEIRDFVEVYLEEHPRVVAPTRPPTTIEERNREAWARDQAESGLNDEEYAAWVKEVEEEWKEPYYPGGYQHPEKVQHADETV